jgi:DNA repair photolyase
MNDSSTPAKLPHAVGRGSQIRPPNRFDSIHQEADLEQILPEDALADDLRIKTTFYDDLSQTILTENDSPDVGFRWSINPYRGCEHGCLYCYARPTHELLGMDAGLDFESKIMVKRNAPHLLRERLNRPSWVGDVIVISGVTDCYQPAERGFRLTRSLLDVMNEANQACGIVTKNALVLRDLDILRSMAERQLVHVNLSITSLDAKLARSMEPRTSLPEQRLRAVRELSAAGIPVRVLVAPVVPGLTDREIPSILKASQEAGAQGAGYVLLRLPLAVLPIFEDWLARERPLDNARITALIRSTREGRMNDSTWGRRMAGQGEYAKQIMETFRIFARKFGLDGDLPKYDTSLFRAPRLIGGQMRLF